MIAIGSAGDSEQDPDDESDSSHDDERQKDVLYTILYSKC